MTSTLILHDAGAPRDDGTQRCLRCGCTLAENGPNVLGIGEWEPHWWPEGPVCQHGGSFYFSGDHPDAEECRA